MTFINYASREINCKIVYYGPGLGGKTTNLQLLHAAAPSKSQIVSLATETDRTLFFDFMPLELGRVNGYQVRLHLYTVPGQVFYAASRQLILNGADGIVLVADSQRERMDANIEALNDLKMNLATHQFELEKMPYVVQANKRDLPNIFTMDELRTGLNFKGEPFIEAVAFEGTGVHETLKQIAALVMRDVRDQNRLAAFFATPDAKQPPVATQTS